MLKLILKALIRHYSLFDINDVLAEIYHEHYLATRNEQYDHISEGYDNLNKDHITGKKLPLC